METLVQREAPRFAFAPRFALCSFQYNCGQQNIIKNYRVKSHDITHDIIKCAFPRYYQSISITFYHKISTLPHKKEIDPLLLLLLLLSLLLLVLEV